MLRLVRLLVILGPNVTRQRSRFSDGLAFTASLAPSVYSNNASPGAKSSVSLLPACDYAHFNCDASEAEHASNRGGVISDGPHYAQAADRFDAVVKDEFRERAD